MSKNIRKSFRRWVHRYFKTFVLVLTIFGLGGTFLQIRSNHIDNKYMYLTGTWNTIMNEALKHPDFNQPILTEKYIDSFRGNKAAEYDIYVRWIGGLIEDLHHNKYRERGWEFFDPWISDMLRTHRKWFMANQKKYENSPGFMQQLKELK